MALKLARAHVDEMIQHAWDDYPNECCGVLAGRGDSVERVYRVKNAHNSPYTFYLEDGDHLRVEKEIDALGMEVVGFYHSHTWSPPNPSPTDVANAFQRDSQTGAVRAPYPNSGYIIISLQNRKAPDVRAFRIGDSAIMREDLVVT